MGQLAEVNVSRLRYPLDDSRMVGFREGVARVIGLAESTPGFVWRLAVPGGHVDGEPLLGPGTILNVSVWADYESLHAFTYRSVHGRYLGARSQWFEPVDGPTTALWWVRAGVQPSAEQAVARLRHLRRWGPTAQAFSLLRQFDDQGRPVNVERPRRRGRGRPD